MNTDPLKGLFVAGWPWGVVTIGVAAALGGLGGVVQTLVDGEFVPKKIVRSGLVGMIAALAALWAKPPAPTWSLIELVGFCLASGFFGQVVLASIKARVSNGLLEDKLAKTANVADDAIREAASRPAPAPAPPGAPEIGDPAIDRLRGRLREARSIP